jgi:protein O-mannosyl-transferase
MIASRMPMRTSPVWLLLLAAVAFGGSLWAGFFLDDYSIFSDPAITNPSGWYEVWRPEQTRPLTYFTFWLNYHLVPDTFGFHAVNLGLHLCAVWLAFSALRRLMPEAAAWTAAAIFAVHPLQAEAVNYVFARSTLLMAVFCLMSLNDWVRARHWRAVVWFGLAMLAKEEAVAWPVFIALLHWSMSRNAAEWRAIAAMFGLALVLGARVLFAAVVTAGSGAGPHAGISAWGYFWTQGLVILRYFATLVAPLLPYRVDSPVGPGFYWWAWLAIVVGAALALRYSGRAKWALWALAALVLLLPSSSIFPAADLAADRRMYLPVLAAGAGLAVRFSWMSHAVYALVLLSILRTADWLDPERFWRKQAEGGSTRSVVQLARVVEPAESARLLEDAKRKSPNDALVASELGRVYASSGAPEKALAEFGRALALTPNSPQALSNRGVALLLMKQHDAARMDFERALQIDPCAFEARLNASRMGLRLPPDSQCRFTPEERKALAGE